jgi:hypothetical protein
MFLIKSILEAKEPVYSKASPIHLVNSIICNDNIVLQNPVGYGRKYWRTFEQVTIILPFKKEMFLVKIIRSKSLPS